MKYYFICYNRRFRNSSTNEVEYKNEFIDIHPLKWLEANNDYKYSDYINVLINWKTISESDYILYRS